MGYSAIRRSQCRADERGRAREVEPPLAARSAMRHRSTRDLDCCRDSTQRVPREEPRRALRDWPRLFQAQQMVCTRARAQSPVVEAARSAVPRTRGTPRRSPPPPAIARVPECVWPPLSRTATTATQAPRHLRTCRRHAPPDPNFPGVRDPAVRGTPGRRSGSRSRPRLQRGTRLVLLETHSHPPARVPTGWSSGYDP